MRRRRAEGAVWRSKYRALADAPLQEKLDLKRAQEEALEVNAEEEHIEQVAQRPARNLTRCQVRTVACSGRCQVQEIEVAACIGANPMPSAVDMARM